MIALLVCVLAADPGTAAPSAPPRWWQFPDAPFRSELRSLRLRVSLTEDEAAAAEAMLAESRSLIAAHVAAHRAEIDRLAADYSAHRRRVIDGGADPAEAAAIAARSAELYRPIGERLAAFRTAVRDLRRTAVRGPAGSDRPAPAPPAPPPASEAPAPPPTEASDVPPAPGSAGPWATAEDVAALIRSLPARPADAEVADVPAAEREALAAEWAKLDRVLAILQSRPGAVRRADLDIIRRHWTDTVDRAETLRAVSDPR